MGVVGVCCSGWICSFSMICSCCSCCGGTANCWVSCGGGPGICCCCCSRGCCDVLSTRSINGGGEPVRIPESEPAIPDTGRDDDSAGTCFLWITERLAEPEARRRLQNPQTIARYDVSRGWPSPRLLCGLEALAQDHQCARSQSPGTF